MSEDSEHKVVKPLEQCARAKAEAKMQKILNKLGIRLRVVWTPNPDHNKHGFIEQNSGTLFLFDKEENEAWQTFIHEALEWKFKHVSQAYRTIINSLIEALEKVVYTRKEEFLEFMPQLIKMLEEEKKIDED